MEKESAPQSSRKCEKSDSPVRLRPWAQACAPLPPPPSSRRVPSRSVRPGRTRERAAVATRTCAARVFGAGAALRVAQAVQHHSASDVPTCQLRLQCQPGPRSPHKRVASSASRAALRQRARCWRADRAAVAVMNCVRNGRGGWQLPWLSTGAVALGPGLAHWGPAAEF
eukprot:55708-Chlamydomonas_euryale.AAC.3